MTNKKLHVRFRLTPKENFARFRRFGSQQRLEEWRR